MLPEFTGAATSSVKLMLPELTGAAISSVKLMLSEFTGAATSSVKFIPPEPAAADLSVFILSASSAEISWKLMPPKRPTAISYSLRSTTSSAAIYLSTADGFCSSIPRRGFSQSNISLTGSSSSSSSAAGVS